VLCREHGQQLAAAKRDTNQLEGFNLFGIIKEAGRVRFQEPVIIAPSVATTTTTRFSHLSDETKKLSLTFFLFFLLSCCFCMV
jgi:hypothetical protein